MSILSFCIHSHTYIYSHDHLSNRQNITQLISTYGYPNYYECILNDNRINITFFIVILLEINVSYSKRIRLR